MSSTPSEDCLETHGHCACLTHTFTIHGRPTNVANCHCSLCRRHSGMAFSTYFTVEEEQYEGSLASLLGSTVGAKAKGGKSAAGDEKDKNDVYVYTSDIAERFFCSHCGTPVLMRYFCTPKTLHIPLGLIDFPAPLPTSTSQSAEESAKFLEEFRKAYKPRQDIWVESRAWWVPSTDGEGREQFEQDDQEFLEKCQRWREREGKK